MKYVINGILIGFLLWVGLSYIECVAKIWAETYDYSTINFFNLLF